MAKIKTKELMPIGGTIVHDEYSLKIEKRLQSGLTGEVYEGWLTKEDGTKVHVAVKAMKTLEFPAARQLFLQESETLAFLMPLEEQANREQGVSLKVAPVYYGRGEYQEIPYLVMEFIPGRQIITDLLPNKDGDKFFEERLAVTAAWHLFRMLDVLHRLLKKTYIDLKSENLWWVDSGKNTGYLKMTDFGTMEEIKSGDTQRRGVGRDLLRASSYFCKMTTGYMPDFLLDELRRFDDLKKTLSNASISWGTRRELKRLLHRDSAQRPADAAMVAANLRTLVDFWTLDEQKVLDVARKTLERAQTAYDEAEEKKTTLSQKGLDAAQRAKSAIEILSLRAPEMELAHEKEQLAQILKSADHLERGKNLLRGRSYKLAKDVFREGMIWEEDAAALRRWAYLAELGESISPSDFELVQERAFAALEDLFPRGLWLDALKEFEGIQSLLEERVKSKLIFKGLDYLQTESRLFSKSALADEALSKDDYSAAEIYYKEAQEELNLLPPEYQKSIRENDLGDLWQSVLNMQQKAEEQKRYGEVDAQFDAAIQFFSQYGLEEDGTTLAERRDAETAYRKGCEAKHNAVRLHEVIRAALKNKNYKQAFRLAQIALLQPLPPEADAKKESEVSSPYPLLKNLVEPLQDDLRLTQSLYFAAEALRDKIPNDLQFKASLSVALEFTKTDELAKICVDDLISQAVAAAKDRADADMYRTLGELHQQMGSAYADALLSEANILQKKQAGERHARVDKLFAEAKSLDALNLSDFNVEKYPLPDVLQILSDNARRYEYILQLLDVARDIAQVDGYRFEEIKTSCEKISTEIQSISKKQIDGYDEALLALNRWWMKIEPLAQWRVRSMELFRESDASQSIHRQLYGEVSDFLAACYALLQGKRSAELEEKIAADSITENVQPVPPEESRAAVYVLIKNAHRVLNNLGPDAWRAIQKDSKLALDKTESFLSNAKDAFEQDNLGQALVLLEQSKPFAEATAEWKALRAQTLRVSLWKKWQRDHAEKLQSLRYDHELLDAIRAYKAQKLPDVYWQKSKAREYTQELERQCSAMIPELLGDHNAPNSPLADTLAHWLDASWANRSPLPADSTWTGQAWLASIYPMILNKDVEGIARVVRGANAPANIKEALAGIHAKTWQSIVKQKEAERRAVAQRKQDRQRNVMIGAGLVAMLCIGIILLGLIFREPIGQVVNGTYTPTPTLTATSTPTFTPMPTFTLTETPTPTLIPTSTFIAPDVKVILPPLPVAAEQAWILMPDNAAAEPPVTDTKMWTKETSADTNTKGETFYSTQKPARVLWETDQPLYGGLYEVFVLDTKSKSGGMAPLQFQVLADKKPINPFRGQPVATFKSSAQKQAADEWISLGVYEVADGQKFGLLTNIPALQGDAFFALSKVVIVKLSDPQKTLYEGLPQGRVLSALADDAASSVLDVASNAALGENYQGAAFAEPVSWGGGFRSLPLDLLKGVSTKVTVQWNFSGVLQPGKYQLVAFIPAHDATAQGEFSIRLNGKPVDKQTLPLIDQKSMAGKWWQGDMWTIAEPGAVTIRLTVDPAANPGGLLGIDAVALLRVE